MSLRELVRQSGVAALSVDYQLSPEAKFPVAYEEMVAVTRLAAREGAGFGIDPTRLAVGGDFGRRQSGARRRRWRCAMPARERSASSC